MKITGIDKELLTLLRAVAKDSHPREFIGILTAEKGILNELQIIPGTQTGVSSAKLALDMVPIGYNIAGSAHSHPNGVLSPSDADRLFFSKYGSCHLIIGSPYLEHNWRAFTANGEVLSIEVIG